MKSYVAYLDILGFSNLIENNREIDTLTQIVQKLWDGFNQAVETSRTISGSDNDSKIVLKDLIFLLVSDSVIIWTKDNSFNSFRHLFGATSCLLSCGLQNGFPLRGSICCGDIVSYNYDNQDSNDPIFFNNESLYGNTYINAYKLEKQQNWSGCIIAPSAWQTLTEKWESASANTHIANPNEYIQIFPYLIWYPVPFKSGYRNALSINWNHDKAWDETKVVESLIVEKSFSFYRAQTLSSKDVNTKTEETLRFLQYTNKYQSNSKQSGSVIPTPDLFYSTIDDESFIKQISND